MVNWPLVGHKITLPPTVQHVLYVTLTTLCPPRLFPASSPVNRTNIGRPPLVWFSRLIPWAHGRRGGGSAELRLQGWGGGFCGNRARPAEKNPCNGPVLRYHGVRRPAAPRVFSLPLLWLGLVLGGGLPCPRVTGSYRPSGPRGCRRVRRCSGRACRHGSSLHRVPGLTGRVDSLVGGRALVRHATVCDEPLAAE